MRKKGILWLIAWRLKLTNNTLHFFHDSLLHNATKVERGMASMWFLCHIAVLWSCINSSFFKTQATILSCVCKHHWIAWYPQSIWRVGGPGCHLGTLCIIYVCVSICASFFQCLFFLLVSKLVYEKLVITLNIFKFIKVYFKYSL